MPDFWNKLRRPIIGLSPMDGVTDAPYREIAARHGRPSITYTEFVPVEALVFAMEKALVDLEYGEAERPVIAQFYGKDPRGFFQAGVTAGALGFDGVDINMGCPAKSIAQRGCGAALIENPELAKDLVRAAKAGVAAWVNGVNVEEIGLPPKALRKVNEWIERRGCLAERKPMPVSIKTRVGVSSIVVEDWIKHLLDVEPAAIAIHGRTLKQLYTGEASWEAIGRAAAVARGSGALILGNGDVKNYADALERARIYGTDGVLIGRASIGNPWVFRGDGSGVGTDSGPTLRDRIVTAMEHVRVFAAAVPERHFVKIRRPLHRYCRGFPGVAELRKALMLAPTADDCLRLLSDTLASLEQMGLADQRLAVDAVEREAECVA